MREFFRWFVAMCFLVWIGSVIFTGILTAIMGKVMPIIESAGR